MWRTSTARRLGPALAAVAVAWGAAAAPVAPAPAAPPAGERVLVRMADDAVRDDRLAVARALNAERVRDVVGGWRIYDLRAPLDGAALERRVGGLEGVEAATPDLVVRSAVHEPNDPRFPAQRAHLTQIGATRAWGQLRPSGYGAPVTVAVVDSGIEANHPDLAGRLWTNPAEAGGAAGVDDDGNGVVDDIIGARFINSVRDGRASPDPRGHGSHVAGLIGAGIDNGVGIAGLAPNARIMAVRFIGDDGFGGLADLLAAIDYAVANGAQVINGSWGVEVPYGTGPSPLCDALDAAARRGVISVVASGNDGVDVDRPGGNFSSEAGTEVRHEPATCASAGLVVVGATDPATDRLAGYSNWGATSVDMAAPGGGFAAGLWSLCVPGLAGCVGTGLDRYIALTGTSMAAPLVAATAALVLGSTPGLSPSVLARVLTESGSPHLVPASPSAPRVASGRRLDVEAALALARTLPVLDLAGTAVAAEGPADGVALAVQPTFSWRVDGPTEGIQGQRLLIDGVVRAQPPPEARALTLDVPLEEGRYRWALRLVGINGEVTGAERTLIIDTTPPEAVAVSGTVRGSQVDLSWGEPIDRGSAVATIQIVRAGAVVATLPGGARGHTLDGAPSPGGAEVLAVELVDAAGNRRRQTVVVAAPATPATPAAPPAPAPLRPGALTPTAPAGAGTGGGPAAGGGGAASVLRMLPVAPAGHRRRYEVRATVAGRTRVVARGTLAPRATRVPVRIEAALATAGVRLGVRTARMHSTAVRRTIRLPRAAGARRYVVRAHDLSLRWVIARGNVGPRVRVLRVRLPRAVAARGPRLSIHLVPRRAS